MCGHAPRGTAIRPQMASMAGPDATGPPDRGRTAMIIVETVLDIVADIVFGTASRVVRIVRPERGEPCELCGR